MSLTIHDATPSDSGPWGIYHGQASRDDQDVHLVPMFDRGHLLTRKCRCQPSIVHETCGEVITHNVAQ